MAWAILKFKLPEEKNEFLIAQRGIDFYCAILEIHRILRDVEKYGKKPKDALKEIEQEAFGCHTDDIE